MPWVLGTPGAAALAGAMRSSPLGQIWRRSRADEPSPWVGSGPRTICLIPGLQVISLNQNKDDT